MQSFFSERSTALELIDGPVDSAAELAGSFGDIAFANRWFGGIGAAASALRDLAARTVLDAGAGICDIPAELSRRARKRGGDLRITCLDNNARLMEIARERYGADSRMAFRVGDAKALPFEDGAFDVCMCNLALHHFDPPDAVVLMREMRRVSRVTPVITDLRRSVLTFSAVFAFTRFSSNRLTRHDGPLSARRAYTLSEATELARRAGWRAPQSRSYAVIRMVLRDAPV